MEEPQANDEHSRLSAETWRGVVKAIEEAIPLYDKVNDAISFGRAQIARKFAINALPISDGLTILDSGVGPGTTSKLILDSSRPSLLIGFDGSAKQLVAAKTRLRGSADGVLQFVCGSFEYLPFRPSSFDLVITCYALRDSVEISQAIEEYHSVCNYSGAFVDVDIGKPDNPIKRAGSTLYVRYLMPIIAKVMITGRMQGNPWRMIAPTYKPLPTNKRLREKIGSKFAQLQSKEFLMGGIVVIIGRKN